MAVSIFTLTGVIFDLCFFFQNGYEKVDRDYVLKVAQLAKKCGTSDFHVISSMCADATSSDLYTRVKVQLNWVKSVESK